MYANKQIRKVNINPINYFKDNQNENNCLCHSFKPSTSDTKPPTKLSAIKQQEEDKIKKREAEKRTLDKVNNFFLLYTLTSK